MSLRLVLFGDGLWAQRGLERVLTEGYTVVGVVLRRKPTHPDLRAVAERAGIRVFQPARVNAPEFVETLKALDPDLGVSVAYDQIFRRRLLELPRLGMVNFHAGRLPYYRGRNVINWAIINGERELGITAHFVNEGIDTGEIILQKLLPILWEDTYAEVLAKAVEAIPELMSETLALIARGQAPRKPQPLSGGTYFGGRVEGDEWIDWSDTSLNIYNKVRAITRPGPGARTLLEGRQVIVWRAHYDPTWPRYTATPGEVVGRLKGRGVIVKTGDSTLLLTSTQVEGGEEGVPDFPIGTRFGLNLLAEVRRLSKEVEELRRAWGQGAAQREVKP